MFNLIQNVCERDIHTMVLKDFLPLEDEIPETNDKYDFWLKMTSEKIIYKVE